MKKSLIEFAKIYYDLANDNNKSLEFRIVSSQQDWDRLLAIAPDSRLTKKALPLHKPSDGLRPDDKNKPVSEQKLSSTSFLAIDKKSGSTVIGSTIFLFPPELKKQYDLLKIDGDLLIPLTYHDINPEYRDLVFMGFTASEKQHRSRYSVSYVRAYTLWMNTMREYYSLDCDVLSNTQGALSASKCKPLEFPYEITKLPIDISDKIGKEHPSAKGSNKFCELIGMNKEKDLVARVNLGPIYTGEIADLKLKY